MRVVWSTLIVLVLLAPFGRVGITRTPSDTDVVTMPRAQIALAAVQVTPDDPSIGSPPLVVWTMGVAAYVPPAVDIVSALVPVPGHSPAFVESLAIAAPGARGPPA